MPQAALGSTVDVWAASGDDSVFVGAGSLYVLRAAMSEPTKLADLDAQALLADGERVYGVRSGDSKVASGEVWWHSLEGSAGGTIAAKQAYPTGIARCGNRIYWSTSGGDKDQGTISSASLDGHDVKTVVSDQLGASYLVTD